MLLSVVHVPQDIIHWHKLQHVLNVLLGLMPLQQETQHAYHVLLGAMQPLQPLPRVLHVVREVMLQALGRVVVLAVLLGHSSQTRGSQIA